MGWLTQTGTPGNTAIIWPTRVPGRGSPTQDIDTKTGLPVTGLLQALLITDWLDTTIGAKLEIFTGAEQTLLHTIWIRFGDDSIPDYLPFRIPLHEDGLVMPDVWSVRFSCANGQFDAILIFRENP